MFDTFAGSILQSGLTPVLFLICTAVSLLLGLGTALIYMHRSHYSKSFVITLALLPAMVQLVIMLVNGNLGTGVAVAGLSVSSVSVRFRAVPRKSAASFSPWRSAWPPAWGICCSGSCFSWWWGRRCCCSTPPGSVNPARGIACCGS